MKTCDLKVPKYPLHNALRTLNAGLSQSQCVAGIEQFDWPVGVYCELSAFCGLGLDDNKDYSSFITTVVEPVGELCQVFINWRVLQCEDFRQKLLDIRIMRG